MFSSPPVTLSSCTQFSHYQLGDQYNARTKTINFNLKKNMELRDQVSL